MNESAPINTVDTSEPVTSRDGPVAENATAEEVTQINKERFIPVSRFAVIDRVHRQENWPEEEFGDIKYLLNYLAAWRHQSYTEQLFKLKEAYLPFSPDRDTVQVLNYSRQQMDEKRQRLVASLKSMVIQANYTEITEADINAYFEAQSPYGLKLKVDLDEFDELLLFSRGSSTRVFRKRDWRWLYLRKSETVEPIFQRLFLLIKLKPQSARIEEIMRAESCTQEKAQSILKKKRRNLPENATSDHVYLKLFKNINQSDLEMLFPNTEVEFRLFDKVRLGVTAGGGTLASVMGTATKVLAATNPIALAGALAGLIGVIFRQVMKFFNQRNVYMMVLAQNLYFHNLANNRGVLTLLSDRAEEEDIKEDLLLYTYLCQYDVPKGQLFMAKRAIESYIKSEFDVYVDYDIDDALSRLDRDGLIVQDAEEVLSVIRPREAIAILENKWINCIRERSDSGDLQVVKPETA